MLGVLCLSLLIVIVRNTGVVLREIELSTADTSISRDLDIYVQSLTEGRLESTPAKA